MLNYTLRIAAGLLLFVVPGVMAFYRYRYVFYVMADNPEWGVLKCFRECRKLMVGKKMRSFRLDLSYWRLILLLLLSAAVFLMCAVGVYAAHRMGHALWVGGLTLLAMLPLFAVCVLSFVTSYSIAVGQVLLYREFTEEESSDAP